MYLDEAKVISNELLQERYDNDLVDAVHRTHLLNLEPKLPYTDKEIRIALHDHYHLSCGCPHDYCGHYFGGVVKVVQDLNLWTVKTSYYRNY